MLVIMKLVIREATAEDIPSIVKVRRAAFTQEEVRGFTTPEPSIYYTCEGLRRVWEKENVLKDGWEIAVAESKGGIVGFIVYKMEGGCGFIDLIDVAKDSQGKGVGRSLVTHAEETAKAAGCRKMQTDTTENAEGIPWKAYSFWKKMGYRDTGERLPTEWDFKTIPFEKNLK